jgi:hypothetical protein
VQIDSDSDVDQLEPAILISPVKAWATKRGIANKSDVEVWSLPDKEIIGEWSSSKKLEPIQISMCIQRL